MTYYRNLVDAVEKMNEKNCEKFIKHVFNYLKDFPPKDSETMEVDEENHHRLEKDGNIVDSSKKKDKHKILFKVLLMENVHLLNYWIR